MRVLVTGASGFIGQSLVRRLLEKGHDVRALVRKPPLTAATARLEYVVGDMTDHASLDRACQGMEGVVHLACATGVADPKIVRAVNVDGTRALLDAAKKHGVRRFVFISTISAARRRRGPYGQTKREGEAMVAASGLEFVTLRPSLVYGSGNVGLFATLAAYLRSLPVVPVIGNGLIELDPVHIDDVNAVTEESLTRTDVVGRTYDVLGPEKVTFNDFLALVSRSLAVKKPVFHIPGPIALLMASMLGIVSKRPPVSVDNVLGMISPADVDKGPLQRDFKRDWIRLEDGLRTPGSGTGGSVRVASGPPAAAGSWSSSGGIEMGAAGDSEAHGTGRAPSFIPIAPLLADSPKPLRPVKVGVVGLGKMGVAHTAVLAMIPDCQVVGLVDHHPGLAKSIRGMGHDAPYFKSVDQMIERATPDAVFVLTPQDSHLTVAKLALEAGCAVFVEKPLAHTLADAEALATLAAEKRRPVSCGYTLAYLPVFATAQHALASGAIGTVRQARSSMYLSQVFGPRKGWMYDAHRSGGGVVANISSHLLFLLEWFLGTPVEVRATASRLYSQVEDELHGMMRLASGAEVGFDSSWSVPGYPMSAVVIEVEGDNGKMLVSNDGIELDLRSPRGGWPEGYCKVRNADLRQPARYDVNGEGYYLEDAAFLRWATGGLAPPTTVEAALRVQRTMDALYRSAAADGASIKVGGGA
jgi:NADH dehydrogenase